VNLRHRWSELHSARLGWAYSAYAKFLGKIDPELKVLFSQGPGEVMVVLYGETQVGKTTLLLKLLGIRHDEMQKVSRILRGKQSKGKSSTAVPMRYVESIDHNWKLTNGSTSESFDDDQDVEEKLSKIRADVECGSYNNDQSNTMVLHIPNQYFDPQQKDRLRINILDLPGVNPRNTNESKYVKKIAERYVPVADLILMVGRSDSLSFLNPEKMEIPQLADWSCTPKRFRLITTYSTQAQSFIDWLNKLESPSKSKFRDKLLNEVATHQFRLPDEVKSEYFYPLEFGDSWLKLESAKPDIFNKVSPVMDELFEDLHCDIAKSATEHNRIMQAAQLHIHAAKLKEKKLGEFAKLIDTLEKKLDKEKSTCNFFLEYAERKVKAKETEEGIHSEKSNEAKDLIRKIEKKIYAEGIKKGIQGNRNELLVYLVDRAEELKKVTQDFLGEVREVFDVPMESALSEKIVNKLIDVSFADIRKKLNGYVLEDYFPRISGQYRKDVEECISLVKNVQDKLREKAKETVSHCLGDSQKFLNDKSKSIEVELGNVCISVRRIQVKICDIEKNITSTKKKQEDFEVQIKSSLDQADMFISSLNDEFDREVKQRQIRMESLSPAMRFIEICGILQMKSERDKLFANT
jgi:energy-coupling factor transporter ATP-binding protein EcfA2